MIPWSNMDLPGREAWNIIRKILRNSPTGATWMNLSEVWDSGWVQATILAVAVLAAVAVAYTVSL
jgi:hypothetical protein